MHEKKSVDSGGIWRYLVVLQDISDLSGISGLKDSF